jgi:hypothetical protein
MFGALLAGAWFLSGHSALVSAPSSSFSATCTASSSQESGVVSVANQPPGDTVIVLSVTVPPPSIWIAVREVHSNDLGNVLGAARVDGPRNSVSIPLLRATVPGRSYAIELYRDDGNGVFDLAVNSVYIDFTTGAPVIAYFTTTQ